jgi:hypothetical protein
MKTQEKLSFLVYRTIARYGKLDLIPIFIGAALFVVMMGVLASSWTLDLDDPIFLERRMLAGEIGLVGIVIMLLSLDRKWLLRIFDSKVCHFFENKRLIQVKISDPSVLKTFSVDSSRITEEVADTNSNNRFYLKLVILQETEEDTPVILMVRAYQPEKKTFYIDEISISDITECNARDGMYELMLGDCKMTFASSDRSLRKFFHEVNKLSKTNPATA